MQAAFVQRSGQSWASIGGGEAWMAVVAEGPPGCGCPRCYSWGGWSSSLLPRARDCWAEFFHAAKLAQLPLASLEIKGISDIPMESNSALFVSSVPFCCTSVSFCPLLWLFWNLDLRHTHTHQPRASKLLRPSTSSATDPFLSRNNDRCWWGARFDIHLGVQRHAISDVTKN